MGSSSGNLETDFVSQRLSIDNRDGWKAAKPLTVGQFWAEYTEDGRFVDPDGRNTLGIGKCHAGWTVSWFIYMGVEPKIGLGPQNGWFIMENPIKMDDLGVPLLLETPIYIHLNYIVKDSDY